MNAPDNLGTLNFIPVFSKKVGSFYKKFPNVYEFYGNTSLVDSGEAWIKVLSKEDYGELTESQSALYDEVLGLIKTLRNDYELSYEELRRRDYSVFFGIGTSMVTSEGKSNDNFKGQPAIYVYPNLNPITAFATCANAFKVTYAANPQALSYVFNTSNTGKRGTVQLSFTRKTSGQGYDCSMQFNLNSEFNQFADPNLVIGEDLLEQFDNIDSKFLGWQCDKNTHSLFNEVLFKELRDGLRLRLKEEIGEPSTESTQVYENKNDLTPKKDSSVPF